MKKIIGFATQFYTLWNYEQIPQYKTDGYGNHHQSGVEHKYYYCKNVSTDLNKVKSLFPNVEIDEQLHGTSSFTRNEKLDLPENYFWGGKYAGRLIDEILEIDFKYCLWSAENYSMPYIKNHPKYTAHFEGIEQKNKLDIEKAQTVKAGDEVELYFSSNGYNADDNYTRCWTRASLGQTELKILCCGVKPVNGMYPYLMAKVNGRFQRTNGKSIIVKVLEVFSTNIYRGIVEQQIRIA